MTKTELLEQILAELKAIRAALQTQTSRTVDVSGDTNFVAKFELGNPIDDNEAVYIVQEIAEAGRY